MAKAGGDRSTQRGAAGVFASQMERATLVLRHADRFVCQPQWAIPPEQTQSYALFYVAQGVGWVSYDGVRLDVKPGDLCLPRVGETLASGHDPHRPITVYSFGFRIESDWGTDPLLAVDWPYRLRLTSSQRKYWAARCQTLVDHVHRQTLADQLHARAILLELIGKTLTWCDAAGDRADRRTGPAADGQSRMGSVMQWIDEHLDEPITAETLAAVASLSVGHFGVLFRRHTRLTPTTYVRQRRVDRAKLLLATSDQSVAEIAAAVGFDDAFHFSRVFSRLEGQAPSAYRRSCLRPFLS